MMMKGAVAVFGAFASSLGACSAHSAASLDAGSLAAENDGSGGAARDGAGEEAGGWQDASPASDATTSPVDAGEAGVAPEASAIDATADLPASCTDLKDSSNIGCEFYAYETYGQIASVPSPGYMEDNAFGDCYAAIVVNASSVPVGVSVDRKGQAFPDLSHVAFLASGSGARVSYAPLPQGKIPPGQSATLFLAGQSGRCPSVASPLVSTSAPTIGDGMDAPKKSLLGYSFHLTTDAPVAVFDVFPYTGVATGATMLIPARAWSTNHVAIDPGFVGYLQGGFGVVAAEDGTSVSITPIEDIGWEDYSATPAFTQVTRVMNRGDILQVVHKRYNGSRVVADKPIGAWAMHQCFVMGSPANSTECDNVHQAIPPLQSWGSEYAAVGHRARDGSPGQENGLYRIVAAVGGTNLTYEPSAPSGAPTTIGANEEAWFRSAQPFVVRSQDAAHPFLLLTHMTTCSELTSIAPECRGDSEMVPVLPTPQFLTSYTFATHPLFPETNLVVVRAKAQAGFADVSLDCAAAPVSGWANIDRGGTYQYARVDLSTGNFASRGGCSNGWHRMASSAPFAVTVWQWGTAATEPAFVSQRRSIGYIAGGAVLPLNSVTPVAPTVDPTASGQ
jgi:hypothetical protein